MSAGNIRLYSYWRSSAAYRVRIALNLKGLPFETMPVHLLQDGGQQHTPEFNDLNPQELVPVLLHGSRILRQSMAIIEYLDETHPNPPLLPADPLGRARVRALAQTVACEIHPVNNLRILKYLGGTLKVTDEQRDAWYNHWVLEGLRSYERRLQDLAAQRAAAGLQPSVYSYGDTPTLADCCLVPQIFNGQRFNTPLDGLPRTMAAFDACMALPAFQQAQPSACPDFEA